MTTIRKQLVENVTNTNISVKDFNKIIEQSLFGDSATVSNKRDAMKHGTIYSKIPIKKDYTESCRIFLKKLDNSLIYVAEDDNFCYVAGPMYVLLNNLEPNYFEIVIDNITTDLSDFKNMIRKTLYIETSLENFYALKRHGLHLIITEHPIYEDDSFDMIEPSWWNYKNTTETDKDEFIKSADICSQRYLEARDKIGIPTAWNIKLLSQETCVKLYITGFQMDFDAMFERLINTKTFMDTGLKNLKEMIQKALNKSSF